MKLLLRKGPLATNDKILYESEWSWKAAQINDDQWHSYKLVVSYPKKVSGSPRQASWYSFPVIHRLSCTSMENYLFPAVIISRFSVIIHWQ